jgi:predicted transcriptional regulator
MTLSTWEVTGKKLEEAFNDWFEIYFCGILAVEYEFSECQTQKEGQNITAK